MIRDELDLRWQLPALIALVVAVPNLAKLGPLVVAWLGL